MNNDSVQHTVPILQATIDNDAFGSMNPMRKLPKRFSFMGRKQARAVGDWLRDRGIERARVYSSQWCRCLETTGLLDLGPVAALPGLNSFFDRPQDRAPNLAALRDFLESQPPRGELLNPGHSSGNHLCAYRSARRLGPWCAGKSGRRRYT